MVGVFEGQEQRFVNLMRFLEIVPNERIVMDYGTPEPDDPDRFRATVAFDEQTDGKTVLTNPVPYTPDVDAYKAFLECGLAGFEKYKTTAGQPAIGLNN